MIFNPTTCCACAAVQELQGEAPLTLSGEGLWAGVLSSGQCVLECPGSQSAAGSSGDLLLGFGTFTLRPVTPCHLLCVADRRPCSSFCQLPQLRFADGGFLPQCSGAAGSRVVPGMLTMPPAPLPYTLLCALAHGTRILPSFAVEARAVEGHPR